MLSTENPEKSATQGKSSIITSYASDASPPMMCARFPQSRLGWDIGIGHLYGKPITPMIGGTATQRHNCIGSVLLCSFKICVQLPPNNCTTEQLHSFPADLFLRPSISQLHLGTCSSFSLEKRFRTEKWLTLLVQLYSKYKTIQMSFS